jgi:hypothetical protein
MNSEKILMAQYGQIISLPPSILVDENTIIDICPVTGAIKSISKK